jgi:ribonuclease-3
LTDLIELQQALGIMFKDVSLLERALVHSSYVNENPEIARLSNERLEFLGDAVLGLIVADKLFQEYPDLAEGQMTKLRSALVRRDALVRVTKYIKLGDYLYLGKGEESSGGRYKPANLAAALEAVIAAIFLDQGLSVTRGVVLGLINTELEKQISQGVSVDYKSELQEYTQANKQQAPSYHVIETSGPAHLKTFTVEARLGDMVLGTGTGTSKKKAEMEAAHLALTKIKKNFT